MTSMPSLILVTYMRSLKYNVPGRHKNKVVSVTTTIHSLSSEKHLK